VSCITNTADVDAVKFLISDAATAGSEPIEQLIVANSSKSSQRAVDELQRTITEIEAKYKSELSRLKKKYETELREFEIQIDTLNRNNGELAKANKSLSTHVKVILMMSSMLTQHELSYSNTGSKHT